MCKLRARPGVVRPLLCAALLLGSLLGGCSDCSDGFCEGDPEYSYSSPATQPCATLSLRDCEHASNCIVDSVCAAPAACSSAGCSESCDLVRVCVNYD